MFNNAGGPGSGKNRGARVSGRGFRNPGSRRGPRNPRSQCEPQNPVSWRGPRRGDAAGAGGVEAPLDPGQATLGAGRGRAAKWRCVVRAPRPPVSAPAASILPPPHRRRRRETRRPRRCRGRGARPGAAPPGRPWDPRSAAPPFWARVSAREGGLVRLCPGDDVRVKRGLLFGKPLEK